MSTNRHRAIRVCILAMLAMACMTATSWAATYYVDGSAGNDVNAGSETFPWKTAAKTSSVLKPGDTVYFKSGLSYGTLTPVSGSGGTYVTYAAYGTGAKPIFAGCTVSNKSYIKFQGLQFSSTNANYPLYINASSYIWAENCNIFAESSCTAYAALRIYMNSHHNRIVGCTIVNRNTTTQNDCVNLKFNANNNLIEGNTIGTATHYSLTLEGSSAAYPGYVCSNNIIRDNTIHNPQGAMVEAQSNANRNLFEGNVISGGKTTSFDSNDPNTFKSVGMYNIIRKNILRDNTQSAGHGLSTFAYQYNSDPANNAVGNRVYNNLITAIAASPIVLDNYEPGVCVVKNNVHKNNIVYNNTGYQLIVGGTTGVTDNYFRNNIFYSAATTNVLRIKGSATTVAGVQTSDPAHYSGNIQNDPMLGSGYMPQSGSPCIEAGDFLAKVTSVGGSGSVITVDDAGYFTDGFGVSPGDTIQVGNTTTRITAVNYTTNTLTLADVITWTSGAPVSLPYSGARPDIGPVESGQTAPAVPAPTNLRLL